MMSGCSDDPERQLWEAAGQGFGQLFQAAAVHLVLDGTEPVGCLHSTIHPGLLGIWSMATPPAQRHRGIARAGLTHVLAHRFAASDCRGFLTATEADRPLYDAVGFEVTAWATAWLVPPHDRGA